MNHPTLTLEDVIQKTLEYGEGWDVAACQRRILSRRAGIEGCFTLPRAREIAQVRLERMAQFLRWLDEESFGIL